MERTVDVKVQAKSKTASEIFESRLVDLVIFLSDEFATPLTDVEYEELLDGCVQIWQRITGSRADTLIPSPGRTERCADG